MRERQVHQAGRLPARGQAQRIHPADCVGPKAGQPSPRAEPRVAFRPGTGIDRIVRLLVRDYAASMFDTRTPALPSETNFKTAPDWGKEWETMGRKLFVGNLSFDTTSSDLEALFSEVGSCGSATVITDRETGRSRGFGFVEMSTGDEAQKAIAALNGREVQGRQLNVNEAKERTDGGGGRRRRPRQLRPAQLLT